MNNSKVPKENEQNEQNPGFVHFWSPIKSTESTNEQNPGFRRSSETALFLKGGKFPQRMNKMNKTQVCSFFCSPKSQQN